ncbi:MAG: MliC family protein [Pseudomonadota bacterium]|jgi:membrane-bound inhibitor of C-type lysozyme
MKHLYGSIGLALSGIPLLLAGCGSINIWPFGDSKPQGASVARGPENATEYRCDGGRAFHVRTLEAGKSVWLILPDRQVRLDRVAAEAGNRYSNGIAVLHIGESGATLTDGAAISYAGCKTGTATKP